MPRPKQVSWRQINSPRNSESTAKLDSLDWTNWWTDGWGPGMTHLHVARSEDKTVHRVYCRASEHARIGMRDGTLYWLLDPVKETP